jgi:hypothetical protein
MKVIEKGVRSAEARKRHVKPVILYVEKCSDSLSDG